MVDGASATGMAGWVAEVVVVPKAGVNDPEGEAIFGGLRQLGFGDVDRVTAGRRFEIAMRALDRESAERDVRTMCERLLANPVIQSYRVEVRERVGGDAGIATGEGDG